MSAATIIDQSFLMLCIVAFLVMSFLFLLTILVSRMVKTQSGKRREILRSSLQRKINVLVLSKEVSASLFSWKYHLEDIRSLIQKPIDKQLAIDLITSNKQNLIGHSAVILKKIYIRLGLKRLSQAKLTHPNDLIKIRGLQELARMECSDTLPLIKEMFHRSDLKIRQEIFIAIVQMDGSIPTSLITKYPEPIVGWMKVVIHKHLSSLPIQQLPKFYEWLVSPNRAVKIFALELINQFQQLEATDALGSLLHDDDQNLAVRAACVLSDLGIDRFADDIAALGRKNMDHESRLYNIIRALGKIGSENHKSLLAFHMIHGSYRVRFEAMRALLKLKIPVLDLRIDFNIDHDSEFKEIYNHLTDPLLQ